MTKRWYLQNDAKTLRFGKKECPSCRAYVATRRNLRRDENFARWYADRGHCAYLAASNAHTNAWTSLSLLVAYLPIVLYWTTDRVRALVPAALLVWVSTQIMWLLVSPHNPFPSVCAAANLPDNKLAQQRFQADAAAFREQLGQPPQPLSRPGSLRLLLLHHLRRLLLQLPQRRW